MEQAALSQMILFSSETSSETCKPQNSCCLLVSLSLCLIVLFHGRTPAAAVDLLPDGAL